MSILFPWNLEALIKTFGGGKNLTRTYNTRSNFSFPFFFPSVYNIKIYIRVIYLVSTNENENKATSVVVKVILNYLQITI